MTMTELERMRAERNAAIQDARDTMTILERVAAHLGVPAQALAEDPSLAAGVLHERDKAGALDPEAMAATWNALPDLVVEDHELAGLDAGEQDALFMEKRLGQIRPLLEAVTAERDALRDRLNQARETIRREQAAAAQLRVNLEEARDAQVEAMASADYFRTRMAKAEQERDALQWKLDKVEDQLDKARAERHDAEPVGAELASANAQLEWLETMLESTRVEHDRRMETMKARVACLRAVLQVVRGRGEV